VRGDLTFGEQILDIADDGRNEVKAKNGRLVPNTELVLRSKLRIEARQFHMARLHPQTWGDRQQIDIKNDWALLTDEERRRKAEEIIQMIRELKEPPMQPPPLVYRAEEPTGEPEPGGIRWQPRSATVPEGWCAPCGALAAHSRPGSRSRVSWTPAPFFVAPPGTINPGPIFVVRPRPGSPRAILS